MSIDVREPDRPWWLWGLPLAVFVGHLAVYGDWVVDDAAISFAFAKNLAAGAGAVPCPGSEPVEGFSNPLWVALFVLLHWIGGFDAVVAPKLLSVLFAGLLFREMLRLGPVPVVGACAGVLLAVNPSFVIWMGSGLENPLYALLIGWLLRICVGLPGPSERRPWGRAGVVAVALAATRPDGIVFAALPVAVLGLEWGRAADRRAVLRGGVGYVAITMLLLGGGFLLRYAYFGDWLPNTYYAKGARTSGLAVSAGLRALGLVALFVALRFGLQRGPHRQTLWRTSWAISLAGVAFAALHLHPGLRWLAKDAGIVLAALVLVDGALRPRLERWWIVLALAVVGGLFIYEALPRDWMAEHRFATPTMPAFALLLAAAVGRWLAACVGWRRTVAWSLLALVVAADLGLAGARANAFLAAPTLSIEMVRQRVAEPLFRVSTALVPQDAPHSVLITDIGAVLLDGRLRVVDAGKLCDRTLARALPAGNLAAAHEYLFAERRPALIRTTRTDNEALALHRDPRFSRDYRAVFADPSATAPLGLFVRRDLVPNGVSMDELRARFSR